MSVIPVIGSGPYFPEPSLGLVLFALLTKVIVHFVFISTFRYRVSGPEPMMIGDVVKITAMRDIGGGAIVAGSMIVLAVMVGEAGGVVVWGPLVLERLLIWWALGVWKKLSGLWLAVFVGGGMGIDLSFDVLALYLAFSESAAWSFLAWLGYLVVVASFLVWLFVLGDKDEVKARFFSRKICRACGYDLTGNESGKCPECGSAAWRGREEYSG